MTRKCLVLTDDLQHRIALVRWAADRDDPTVLTTRKVELADALVAAVDRRAGRAARLAHVPTLPAPLAVDLQAARTRRRA